MNIINTILMTRKARVFVVAAAAVMLTFTARAASQTFNLELYSDVALTDVYCIYVARWGEDWFESGTKLTDNLAANTPFNSVFSMQVEDPDSVYAPLSMDYCILGQYQGGVSITFDSSYADSATQAGMDWSQAFSDQYYYKSEDDIAQYLANGDLSPFFLDWFSGRLIDGQLPSVGDSGDLVLFSAAEYGGSVTLTTVPEPCTPALIALGSIVLLLVRHPAKRCRSDSK